MTGLKLFDRIDHLMIEVDDPRAVYEDFHSLQKAKDSKWQSHLGMGLKQVG